VGERVFKWELLWAYRAWIAGESFGRTESIQNINNILVFIPFGALFPGKRWKQLLITAVLFSTTIEAVQYALNLGWCEIDDVICNVLGAAAGFGLWNLIKGKMHAV
jgi:glycopeptide antibiotics resistance protein